jgi:hypothetical protein
MEKADCFPRPDIEDQLLARLGRILGNDPDRNERVIVGLVRKNESLDAISKPAGSNAAKATA